MRRLYLFALFLVLYEFAAYSANDMIMPGMIQVIKDFSASQNYVALSLSLYILGNCALMLPAGFLSERYGKGRIMIIGNFFFLLFTILIMVSQTIDQFMVWRFLQGAGLAIIGIGYALIHENFDDKNAVKLTALMGNISLLAPLIGPAIGSAIVSQLTWHYVFVITAIISGISLVGLFRFSPKDHLTVNKNNDNGLKKYISILKNTQFLKGTLCLTLSTMPALFWISQAPNLILYKLHLSYLHFAIYQLISIGGLTVSSIAMQFIVDRYQIYFLIRWSSMIILLGLLVSLLGYFSINLVALGLFIYTFGIGINNGCFIRLIMSIQGLSTGMVASMLGFIQTLLFVIGITVINFICNYFDYTLLSFTLSAFVTGLIGFILINHHVLAYKERKWQ